MLCSPPSAPKLQSELLADITQALNADGSRLLILAKPLARRAQIYSYGLQPRTSTPIEKNSLWQSLIYPHLTFQSSDAATVQPLAKYPVDRVSQQPALAPLMSAFDLVGIESLLILPLRYHHQCVGCLTVFRSASILNQDFRWTDRQLQLAQSLAIQMYVAVMQQRVEQMFRDRAYYDTLTGLPNRQLLNQYLTLASAKIPSTGEVLAVILVNIDRFKDINDSLGHGVGDRLLQLIAERLENILGTEALIGRWGGDEFALIVPCLSDIPAVNRVADRILNCFNLPFAFDRDFQTLETNLLSTKASIGIAIGTSDVDTLLQHADAALKCAQTNGNSYEIYHPIGGTVVAEKPVPKEDRLYLENTIERAIAHAKGNPFDERKLLLHYQQQLNTQTGKIVGVEALIRCQLHQKLINPADFIPIAEANGSIVQIGEWVIRAACQQKKIWQNMGLGNFPVAVNFSVRQLQDRNLIDTIIAILAEAELSPMELEVEITESIAIENLDLTIAILESLRGIGVKIALDDFGTGYSSLAALKYLPLDRLKIDRSFIRELRANTIDAGIVRTIVNLGHELNLNIVAEGVETVEQLEFLRSINCDAVQGFLFSRPLAASDFESMMITQTNDRHQDLFHPHS